MLNFDRGERKGAAGGRGFLSGKVTQAKKIRKLFSFFLQTLMSFIISVQMKCTIQKCEKKNLKNKSEKNK